MYLLRALTVFKFSSYPFPFLWEVLTKTPSLSMQQKVVPFSLGIRAYFKRSQLLGSLKKICTVSADPWPFSQEGNAESRREHTDCSISKDGRYRREETWAKADGMTVVLLGNS